jgi:hypothetical protein
MLDELAEGRTFDPPIYRYTVRTPESRERAIRAAAEAAGMTPGQLVQALFDRLDLSDMRAVIAPATARFARLFRPGDDGAAVKAYADRLGLTVAELRVFRALAELASGTGIVRPSPGDVFARSGVAEARLAGAYEGLLRKGFIGAAPSQGRGRTAYAIRRCPEL